MPASSGWREISAEKALDPSKDQSYVLYAMTQAQLARTLFPLGALNKRETRQLAERGGFINAQKPSQDICFAPDGDYAKIIELHTGKKSGVRRLCGRGGACPRPSRRVIRYTIGQHRGLGLSAPEKRFVTAIDPVKKNTVTLGAESELYRRDARAAEFNWISGETPDAPNAAPREMRYRQTEQWAWVTPRGGDSEGGDIV